MDINSALPVKTNSAGDVISKIADANTPAQQLKVNVDGSIDVNADLVSGAQVQITDGTDTLQITGAGEATVSITQPLPAGTNNIGDVDVLSLPADVDIRNLVFATDQVDVSGSSVEVTDGGGSITVDATDLDIRALTSADVVTAEQGTSPWVVSATDLDIRDLSASTDSIAAHLLDEAGNAFTSGNPLPVEFFETKTETVNYNTAAAVAANGTSNHTFAAPSGFKLFDVHVSGSGRMKAELQIDSVTVAVGFNSTANPMIKFEFLNGLNASGVDVTIIRTNLENQAKDLYSTISGIV